jgi:hypothetical protein
MLTSGTRLWGHMGDAPVILVPCQRRPVVPPSEALPPELRDWHSAELAYAERIRGASIYPAVQNILLVFCQSCSAAFRADLLPRDLSVGGGGGEAVPGDIDGGGA